MSELNNNNHNNTSWLSVSGLRRILFFLGADALIVAFSLFVAFLVHFDFNSNIRYFSLIGEIALFFVALKLLLHLALRRHYRSAEHLRGDACC